MFRTWLVFTTVGITLWWASVVKGQPAGCSDDISCNTNFYCDRETFHCRECLSCEDLKREPPRLFTPCIRSVVECGACTKGLVEDHRGDVNFVCVPPDTQMDSPGAPAYVWVAIVVGLILLGVLVFVIIYLLRNTYTFKILASTRTSVQSPCSRSNASAPELPPPYDVNTSAPYNPQYTASPPSPRDTLTPVREDDSSWPFIKRVPSERGEGAGEREAAGHQAARVFNYPRYVRAPHLPSSYKSPSKDDESASTFTVHDEDTMESTWTPTPSADHTDNNGNAGSSGPLATLAPAATQGPHASGASFVPHDTLAPHALCSRQDSNNNRNPTESNVSASVAGAVGVAGAPGAAGASGVPSIFINVVQNINAVQQHNDVNL